MKNTKYSHEYASDQEVWKPIQGFEDRYAVSSKGRVMNLKTGRVLKNRIEPHGYAYVDLCNGNGSPKRITVHRLVATTFINNPNNLPQVNHIDEDKRNNDVTNLEWCTASQNNRHSNHQRSCKINQYTLDGELINTWESSHEIERELGFNQSHIISCCKGKYKTAYRFKWEYADGLNQQRHNRPVAALTMDKDLIAEYKSAAEAARCLKIGVRSIRYCLNGTYKSTHGLRFIYID